jgi:ribonuclease HI
MNRPAKGKLDLTAKTSAADLKKMIRETLGLLPAEARADKILLKLANHKAVVKMLAQEFPQAEELDIRKALAKMAGLVATLDDWSAPASGAQKKAQARTSSEAGASDEAPPPALNDPSVLAGHHKVKVFVDGASKGNPGPASVGVVMTDLENQPLYEEGLYIGETTNNVAEYQALIQALETLTSHGCPEAYFFSDSTLMVNQMRGLWKVKNPGLLPMVARAQSLRRKLPRFQIAYVPREQNRRADELANLAYKQAKDAGL